MNVIAYLYYNYKGVKAERQGNYKEAASWYQKAIGKYPTLSIPHCNLANMYFRLGQVDRSIEGYKTAINLNKNHSEAWNGLSTVYLQINQDSLADQCLQQSIRAGPKNAEALNNYGALHLKLANYQVAIGLFTKAISYGKQSKLSSYYFNRGLAYYQSGDQKTAIADFATSISLNPNFGPAFRARGAAYEKIGDISHSEMDRLKANELEGTEEAIAEKIKYLSSQYRVYLNRTQ